jgi:hypothetical protein
MCCEISLTAARKRAIPLTQAKARVWTSFQLVKTAETEPEASAPSWLDKPKVKVANSSRSVSSSQTMEMISAWVPGVLGK